MPLKSYPHLFPQNNMSIGSTSGGYSTGIRLSDVVVRTSSEERTLNLMGEVVFDPSNGLHMLLKPL